uniref:Uncharacterized protein n=1 Tax=Ananas comosus var. bracteatus TaxID=296719 RepID=A0A6V7NJG4_ANACO|nr:unnamed protein product [Ananas comosus var. bracteatus]
MIRRSVAGTELDGLWKPTSNPQPTTSPSGFSSAITLWCRFRWNLDCGNCDCGGDDGASSTRSRKRSSVNGEPRMKVPTRISLDEVTSATAEFHDSNILGHSGSTTMFQGCWLPSQRSPSNALATSSTSWRLPEEPIISFSGNFPNKQFQRNLSISYFTMFNSMYSSIRTRRGTPYAAQAAAVNAIHTAVDQGMQRAEVMIKGLGLGRDAALRAIRRSGILLSFVRDITPMP